jgi:hypothetical protein
MVLPAGEDRGHDLADGSGHEAIMAVASAGTGAPAGLTRADAESPARVSWQTRLAGLHPLGTGTVG